MEGKGLKGRAVKFFLGVIFMVIFLLLFVMATILLKPKFYYQEAGWEPATMIIDGFYDEPKNSIDVLYLGSSVVFRGINPLVAFKDYGITGYVFGSSAQRMWISEFYLKEALKYQKPKTVVLEVQQSYLDSFNDENRNRKALDYIRFSKEKMQAVRDSIPDDGSESFLSYIFPIIRYHSRWNELDRSDFLYFFSDKNFYTKGFDAVFSSEPWVDTYQNSDMEVPVSEKARRSMENIVSLCKQNSMRLVLIKTPCAVWTKGQSDGIRQFAEEYGLEFIEYNDIYAEIGINAETDFQDKIHLNAYGAEKLTKHLGAYLTKRIEFEDKRTDSDYADWFADYEKYEEIKMANRRKDSM